jgi:long-chain fatty acid transport protein
LGIDFFYELGVSRSFKNGWFVNAGYFFSGNSVPARNFNPVVPDTDLHIGSLGFGHKGPRWRYAMSFQIITGPSRRVRNSQSTSLVGASADGDYRWFNPALNVSVGYRF